MASVIGLGVDAAQSASAFLPADRDRGAAGKHDAVDGRKHVNVVKNRNRERAPAHGSGLGCDVHSRKVPKSGAELEPANG